MEDFSFYIYPYIPMIYIVFRNFFKFFQKSSSFFLIFNFFQNAFSRAVLKILQISSRFESSKFFKIHLKFCRALSSSIFLGFFYFLF